MQESKVTKAESTAIAMAQSATEVSASATRTEPVSMATELAAMLRNNQLDVNQAIHYDVTDAVRAKKWIIPLKYTEEEVRAYILLLKADGYKLPAVVTTEAQLLGKESTRDPMKRHMYDKTVLVLGM